MKQTAAGLLACVLLVACGSGSNPFSGDAGTDGTTTDGTTTDGTETDGTTPDDTGTTTIDTSIAIPADIAGNVTGATFDAAAGTLTIEGVNLDEVPFTAVYARAPALDQDGYTAFTIQEDPLDRHFTAYTRQSNDEAVTATVVSSAGPRNRAFKGVHFDRDGAYDPPDVTSTTGLVTYAGRYVGLTNIGDPAGSDLLPTGVTDPELIVPQALIIHGDAFLNADFADNTVEGNIYNRQLLDTNLSVINNLPSLVLIVSDIEPNGTFTGTVEYDIRDPLSGTTNFTQVGTYSGLFGGTDSTSVAGGIEVTEFDGVGNPLGLEAELESGVFVLDQCGTPGDSAVCDSVNPDVGTP